MPERKHFFLNEVFPYVGKNPKLCGDSVEVVPDFFLARIRLAPVQILRRRGKGEKKSEGLPGRS